MTNGTGRNGNRDPGAAVPGSRQARQARAARRRNHRALLVVGLGIGSRLLRDRDFLARVITRAIGAAALASLARDSRSRNVARLAAWDERQRHREQRKAAVPN